MKNIKLNKIPSIFKNTKLSHSVNITTNNLLAQEGAFVVVEILESEGFKQEIDYANGRLGLVVKGDVIPAVLGYRKAPVEFAGVVPKSINVNDELYLLCESGVVGDIKGVFPSWGKPLKVKILGGILNENKQQVKLLDFALPAANQTKTKTPIIAFIGTRMDCGKTIMACKVAHALKQKGKKVAAAKLTGVAFSQDLYKLEEYGANPVLDFVDMGLPSTCNGNVKQVIAAANNLINHLKKSNPNLIILEFGDSIIGEYHVADILQNLNINQQIDGVVLAANDFCGIKGAQKALADLKLKVDLVTGPVVNSQIGIELVDKYFSLPAESNQGEIITTMKVISKIIKQKK